MNFNKKSQSVFQRTRSRLNSLTKYFQPKLDKDEIETKTKMPLRLHKKPEHDVKIVISIDSVIKATFAVLGVIGFVYLLFIIKSTIILFLVALFFSATLNPIVDKMEKHHVPRWVGLILLYLVILGLLTVIFTSLVPLIAEQASGLANQLGGYFQNLIGGNTNSWFISKIQPLIDNFLKSVDKAQIINELTAGLKEIGSRLTNFAGNAIGAIISIFNGLFNFILILVLTFLMVVNKRYTTNLFQSLFPRKHSEYITKKSKEVSIRIGNWLRGQLLVSLSMGILVFIILSILGVNFKLTLAMTAVLAEFLPYLGSLITFALASIIALNQDPVLFLWLIPAYIIIIFIQANILAPMIMGKSVGLNPLVIMFALLAGATLGGALGGSFAFGVFGMIIAVPVANIISIFIEDYTDSKK